MFVLNGFLSFIVFLFWSFVLGVILDQYRACIGLFNSFRVIKCSDFFRASFFHYCLKFIMFSISQIFKHFSFSSVNSAAAEFQFFYMLYSYCIIMQSWDIEANPGPGGWRSSLSVCHWNLNSIWVEDFSKLSQISAFLNIHQFDIFCLTETFLDSSISSEDPRLAIEGYKLFRCDHPSNLRRGGVCLYFKDHLPLALRPDLTTLDECLVCEIQNGSKRFFLTVLYRSPSQSIEQFYFI